jgi:hypothetical protein
MQEVLKIERVHKVCAGCAREFVHGEEVISAVASSAEEQLVRKDYCLACWARPPQEIFSYWRTLYPEKSKPNIEDMDKVQKFFDKLLEKPDPTPEIEGVKFFTALVLARKKRLKLLGSRQEGDRAWIRVEKAWDGEKAEVPDPGITEEQIAQIRADMERLFEMELSAP